MSDAVAISFECIPLRSLGRMDLPLDAPEAQRVRRQQIKQALATHGAHNSYYLADGRCSFQLTNDPAIGLVGFRFDGVVLTNESDTEAKHVELAVELGETACDWLTRAGQDWLSESVGRAVAVEFNRYIASGDLARTIERQQRIAEQSAAAGGYLGQDV